MCLGKVIVEDAHGGPREITDVVEVSADGPGIKVVTLFGEQHTFENRTISHIAMRAGLMISLSDASVR